MLNSKFELQTFPIQPIFELSLKLEPVHIYEFTHQQFTGASTVARDIALDALLNPLAKAQIFNQVSIST